MRFPRAAGPFSTMTVAPIPARDATGALQPSALGAVVTTKAPQRGNSELLAVNVDGHAYRFRTGTAENEFCRNDIVGFDRGDDLVTSRLPGHPAGEGVPATLVAERARHPLLERLGLMAHAMRELAVHGLVDGEVVELHKFRPTLAHAHGQGAMRFAGYVSPRFPVAIESTMHELNGQRVPEYAVLVLDLASGAQYRFQTLNEAVATAAARHAKLNNGVLTVGDEQIAIA